MKRFLGAFAALIFSLSFLIAPATAQISGGTWTLTTESVSLNLAGVSPFVEKTSAGLDRIWFPGAAALPDPVMVVDCTETGICTRQSLASRFGSDTTIVTLKDGTRKAFFVEMGPAGKKIRFATITGNTLAHGEVTDLNVAGASVSQNEMAWGVPDAVLLPDGRVRVYWVLADQATGKPGLPESIVSATSTDATASIFLRDPGTRLTGGYVDTKILRAKDGDWVKFVPGTVTDFHISHHTDLSRSTIEEIFVNRDNLVYYQEVNNWIHFINHTMKNNKIIHWTPFDDNVNLNVNKLLKLETIKMETKVVEDNHYGENAHKKLASIFPISIEICWPERDFWQTNTCFTVLYLPFSK